MKAENISVTVWDGTVLDEDAVESADVVFADVPCSGIGVISKKPDIKYNITPESLESLLHLQKEIMDTVWQYVKPGGTLLYSTCTIHREENEEMVNYLTEQYPFQLESIDAYLPKALHSETTKQGYIQIFPGKNSDGFFMARLKRIEKE